MQSMEKATETIRIGLKRAIDDSYEIIFGKRLFPKVAEDLKKLRLGARYAVITDSNVHKLYANKLNMALNAEGLNSDVFHFKAGEESKTVQTCIEIVLRMQDNNYSRDCAIIALGGGVTGDLAGFAASIFNRGVPYVQVPTTLLAMSDSSIGGKTAVDTEYGKNLIGSFWQPAKVYIDITTLDTLPGREFASGLAEIIKHGVIQDYELFSYLEKNMLHINGKSHGSLLKIVKASCTVKSSIVEKDPEEKGLRRVLNFGHTVGHAVEMLSIKKGDNHLLHGEAISIGMAVEAVIAAKMGIFRLSDALRLKKLLMKAGLPTIIPKYMKPEEIVRLTSFDKKSKAGKARYSLPCRVGMMKDFRGEYATEVECDIVLGSLKGQLD